MHDQSYASYPACHCSLLLFIWLSEDAVSLCFTLYALLAVDFFGHVEAHSQDITWLEILIIKDVPCIK